MPIVLFGEAYWRRIVNFDALIDEGTIAPNDLTLFEFADTAEHTWAALVRRGLRAHIASAEAPAISS
jgi:predicted Rossmann-fold nucleotide-binding protein